VLASEEARALDEVRKELADREIPLAEIERETKGLGAELATLRGNSVAN
jgi:hypothetical protein